MKKKKRIIKRKRQQSNRKIIGIVVFVVCLAATLTLTYYTFSGNDTMKLSNSSESERLGRALGILLKAMASKSQNSGTIVSQERSDTGTSHGTPISKEISEISHSTFISQERDNIHSDIYVSTTPTSNKLNEEIVNIQNSLAQKALGVHYRNISKQEEGRKRIEELKEKAKTGRERRLKEKLNYTERMVREGRVSDEDMITHVKEGYVITGYMYTSTGRKVFKWANPNGLF